MSNRQDFTGYTETDTASRLTVAANTITITGLDDDESALVYKDFTASYFSGDFEHCFEISFSPSASPGIVYPWGVANATDDLSTQIAAGTSALLAVKRNATGTLSICEGDGANVDYSNGTYVTVADLTYYVRVCRDETVGTYGTLYVYLYSDASCCTLLETIIHTLEAKTDFRYLFAFCGQGTGAGGSLINGTVSYLTLESNPYTLKNMITTIRYYLREATASFWSDAELTTYVNRSIREIAERSGCIQHIDTVTTTSGTRTVPYNGYKIVAVEYVPILGKGRYLRLITPQMAGHVSINLQDGVPEYWFEEDDKVGIEPVPNSTYTLRLYVADYPTADLSANTQIPELPMAFRQLIIWMAAYMALVKDKKFSIAVLLYSIVMTDLSFHTADKVINIPTGLKNLRSQ